MESYQKELNQIKKILKENPKGMTVTDISKELHINRNSVAKYMDILLISGRVEMVTFGPAKVFFPSRRIPLSAILNYTSDSLILLDRNLKIIQANDNFLNLIENNRDAIINKKIHNSTLPFFKIPKLITHIENAIDGKESTIETNFQKGKENNYLRIKHIPTTFDDGEPGVTLIIKDITEQRKTREKMNRAIKEWETTLNSITDMISIQDKDFNIIKTNQAFAEFFNLKSKEPIGKKCYEIVHRKNKPHSSCPYKQTLETGKTSTAKFYESSQGKYLQISSSPIIDDNGVLYGSVHIIKETTQEKNIKNE